jgi:hypothetical protein
MFLKVNKIIKETNRFYKLVQNKILLIPACYKFQIYFISKNYKN